MFSTPLVILWAIGTILELDYGIFAKFGLTFLLSTPLLLLTTAHFIIGE